LADELYDKKILYCLNDIIMMPKKVLDNNIFYLFNGVVSSDKEYDFDMLGDKD